MRKLRARELLNNACRFSLPQLGQRRLEQFPAPMKLRLNVVDFGPHIFELCLAAARTIRTHERAALSAAPRAPRDWRNTWIGQHPRRKLFNQRFVLKWQRGERN